MRKPSDNIIGESLALNDALDHLSQLALIPRPVLVLGERGTGKELAAERLHFLSPRWESPFLKVNCAAMAETLLESELFGHEAGAFTGATKQHIGRFERADGGTLFLDEIGTMSLRLQEKLLRLVEYGEFERVGGSRTLRVDVRIVGATNADLREMARGRSFRADLLDRLSFDVVHMPALRERGDDILILARHFAVQMCAEIGWTLFPGFTQDAAQALLAYPWPGNVRELKNVVERSLYRWPEPEEPVGDLVFDPFEVPGQGPAHRETIDPDNQDPDEAGIELGERDLGSDVGHRPSAGAKPVPRDLRAAVDAYERDLLTRALAARDQNQRRTAKDLGLSYDQLRGLVRKHGLRTTSRKRRTGRGD